ncbi:MAG: hypothetical protein U9N39_05175 [Campylobacterota bacterium]|nr:hypothetical protein [Campylobacterota bacterium]
MKNEEEHSLISSELPLIYNLNILENIAIIKEVHENMNTKQAQIVAQESLDRISLPHIGFKRSNECSIMELFYVMVIRACMSKESRIIIQTPEKLIGNLKNIHVALEKITLLDFKKEILIVDTIDNKNFYKGSLCNIVE